MNHPEIDPATGTLVPTPGPNHSLPPLNPFYARSTYAMILAMVLTLASSFGIDLFHWTESLGLGGTEEELIATGERAVSAVQVLLNIASGIWFWWERRAPNYRLSFSAS